MTLADIKSEAQSLITTDNVPGSLEFAEKLEKSLNDNNIKDSNPEAYRELSKIIFQLYVTAIPNISTELFHKIISLNIIEALNPLWQLSVDCPTPFLHRAHLPHSNAIPVGNPCQRDA